MANTAINADNNNDNTGGDNAMQPAESNVDINTNNNSSTQSDQQQLITSVSTKDMKDNSNDEEKKFESKEDDTAQTKADIPQNLEPKPLGKKNKILIATFDASAFHYSFKNQRDPLQIGMFPDYGFLRVPHIGVYGDSYEPTQLRALMELSMTERLVSVLPSSVNAAIKDIMSRTADKKASIASIFDGYASIHQCPPYKPTQHFAMNANNLVNGMFHCWLYKDVESLSSEENQTESLYCGLFEACNVYEVRQDIESVTDRGIAFNTMDKRSCWLHGYAFSPCNNDFARDPQAGFCAFYMLAATMDYSRACLSYHVFANNQDMDEILQWQFKEIRNVKELLTTFQQLQWGSVYKNLQILCEHYK